MTPPSTQRSDSVPGRKWYAVAVLAFLAGMTVFAVFLFARLSNLGDDFVRVTTPGQADLSLNPGTYTIFHEQGGMTDETGRSEEHTSELQSLAYLVCRLLLEKKKNTFLIAIVTTHNT